jgi:hypothetical protein
MAPQLTAQQTKAKALRKVQEARALLETLWPDEEAQALRQILVKAEARMTWLRTYGQDPTATA